MNNKERRRGIVHRYIYEVLAIPVFVALLLYFASLLFQGPVGLKLFDVSLVSLCQNVAFGLVGTAVGASFPLILGGDITFDQSQAIERALETASNLVRQARALRLVAIARARTGENSRAFENDQAFADRFQALLKLAGQIDLLCMDDNLLISRDMLLPTVKRIESGKLQLRILMSSENNAALSIIDTWVRGDETTKNKVKGQLKVLSTLGLNSGNMLELHDRMLPFTMFRGDDYMYVMYFMPNSDTYQGPIIELRRRNPLDDNVAQDDDSPADLFTAYETIFKQWWRDFSPIPREVVPRKDTPSSNVENVSER